MNVANILITWLVLSIPAAMFVGSMIHFGMKGNNDNAE